MTNKRLNIYDGDEFDVNARDTIDISKIHKGKQRRAKNTNAMLDDKSFIKSAEMREKFAALSIVVDEELVVPGASGGGYDYDDEYDDTYDDQAMGEKEPDANELESRRPFVLPQALGGGHKAYVKESEDETDEEERELIRFDFARNPELVRKEAERKRQEAMSKNSKPKSSTAPHRDVTGRAKGQGQAKNVVINRQRKTENKGKRTRAAADNKMSKGMF
jgi:activating signal cointegrator complex subunit 2